MLSACQNSRPAQLIKSEIESERVLTFYFLLGISTWNFYLEGGRLFWLAPGRSDAKANEIDWSRRSASAI